MDMSKKQLEEAVKNMMKLNPCINCNNSTVCKNVCDKYVAFGNLSDILLNIEEKKEKKK